MKHIVILSAFLSPFRSGAEACVEEVPPQVRLRRRAIERVAHERMPEMGEVRPHLVSGRGAGLHLDLGAVGPALFHREDLGACGPLPPTRPDASLQSASSRAKKKRMHFLFVFFFPRFGRGR